MTCPRPTGTQRCWGSEPAVQLKPPSQPPLPPPLGLEGLRSAGNTVGEGLVSRRGHREEAGSQLRPPDTPALRLGGHGEAHVMKGRGQRPAWALGSPEELYWGQALCPLLRLPLGLGWCRRMGECL